MKKKDLGARAPNPRPRRPRKTWHSKVQPHLIFEQVQGTEFFNVFSPGGWGLRIAALFLARPSVSGGVQGIIWWSERPGVQK